MIENDFDSYYSDFSVEAVINGQKEIGILSNEEIDSETGYGIRPVFRCKNHYHEVSQVTIEQKEYQVETVHRLEFGEFLLVLIND